VFPVEAQITALAPARAATEIAIVIPRSLNDPVGLPPFALQPDVAAGPLGQVPGRHERCAALAEGEHLEVGGDRSRSRYSSITPRHWWAIAQSSPSTRITLLTASTTDSRASASTVAAKRGVRGGVGHDDQRGRGGPVGAPPSSRSGSCCWRSGLDRDARARRRPWGDLGEHARPVGDVEADVVPGQHLAHRAHGRSA
jgi:hypothetical protein